MKMMQKNNLININRVRVNINQKILILKTVSELQKNHCPLFRSYSYTSRFIEPKAEESFRWVSTSMSRPISFCRNSASESGSSEQKMWECLLGFDWAGSMRSY